MGQGGKLEEPVTRRISRRNDFRPVGTIRFHDLLLTRDVFQTTQYRPISQRCSKCTSQAGRKNENIVSRPTEWSSNELSKRGQ